jgi:hypothetical protein
MINNFVPYNLFSKIILKMLALYFMLTKDIGFSLFWSGFLVGSVYYVVYNYFFNKNYFLNHTNILNKYLFIAIIFCCVYLVIVPRALFIYPSEGFYIFLDDNEKTFQIQGIQIQYDKFWNAVGALGGAAVFKTEMEAATAVLTSKAVVLSLPPTLKMGFILSSGAASYFTFETSRTIWKAQSVSNTKPSKLDVTVTETNSGSFEAPLENAEYFSTLIDILEGSFNLYICTFIIINLTIIFYIFKKISSLRGELNYNFDWLSKYKYGNIIQTKLKWILNHWRNSNLLFFYIGLFIIWLFSSINIYFIHYVLLGLKSL